MNNLKDMQVVSKVKKENLDSLQYFKSILDEAYSVGLLSNNDMSNIQLQLLELLDKVVYRYNGIDSTSIRKETLEDISDSNIYTIGIYLKTFVNPDDAIKEIKKNGLEYIYEKGKKRIYKMLDIVRIGYVKVKQSMLNIDNDTYIDTIISGIKGFLKIYDPDFKSQDMKITADYPIFNSIIGKLEGVEYIKEYLNSIYLENMFCKCFSEQNIKELLYTYSEDYSELIINIFEIVLIEVIACKLANKDIHDLIITSSELNMIYKIFDNTNEIGIGIIIQKAYEDIQKELFKNNEELQEYIQNNFESIKSIIIFSYNQRKLDNVFLTQKYIGN